MLSKVASSIVSWSCLLALALPPPLLLGAGDGAGAAGLPPCCFLPLLPASLACLPSSLSTWLAFFSEALALGLPCCLAPALPLPASCAGAASLCFFLRPWNCCFTSPHDALPATTSAARRLACRPAQAARSGAA
jgi:hypothetical protein